MVWTNDHDRLLCREILIEEPFKSKVGSRQRGQRWDKVADNLNQQDRPRFWVDQRAVRDRFLKLERGFKMLEEKRASGLSPPERSEVEEAICEIIKRGDEAHNEMVKMGASMVEKDMESVDTTRKRLIDILTEAREKESQEAENKRRKSDCNNEEVADDSTEKVDIEIQLKREELELRKKEIEIKEKEKEREWEIKVKELEIKEKDHDKRAMREKELMVMLQQQIDKQMVMQQQLQQQNQLLFDIMKRFFDKVS
ncbi:DNA ligase 1-like isoform X2 [Rhopilema esculentum]